MRPLLALALLPLLQNPAPAPRAGAPADPAALARTWIPALGEVRVDALGGTRLRVAILGEDPRTVELELEGFAAGARIRAAAAGDFLGTDVALALALEQGDTLTYHFLVHRPIEASPELVRVSSGATRDHWYLSPALFESTGDPYRIVDLHCPGGDALEITYRRGFPRISGLPRPIEVDEKLYFDACPGAPPAGVLLDVGELQPVR